MSSGTAADTASVECERKLLVPGPIDPAQVEAAIHASGFVCRGSARTRQQDRYLDSPGGALVAAGVSLRLRTTPDAAVLTWKCVGTTKGDLHERPEIEVAWAQGGPPRAADELPTVLRDRVEPYLYADGLVLLAELETERHTWSLACRETGAMLELAADSVTSAHGGFHELEIEGEAAAAGPARALAERLLRACGGEASGIDKLRRVLALAGRVQAPLAEAERMPAGATTRDALAALLQGRWLAVQRREVLVRTGADPEAVHKMRVACRKLRSALRLAGRLLRKPGRRVARCIGRTAEVLGQVRDLDVHRAELAEVRGEVPAQLWPSFDAVVTTLQVHRAEARERLLEHLRQPERLRAWGKGQRRLLAALQDVAATPDAAAFVRRRIRKLAVKGFALGDAIRPATPPPVLHRLRIVLKRLRYALEFAQELLPDEVTDLAKTLAKAQSLLGTCNDAATARRDLPDRLPLHDDEDLALAAGLALLQRRSRMARAAFTALWSGFATDPNRALLGAGS